MSASKHTHVDGKAGGPHRGANKLELRCAALDCPCTAIAAHTTELAAVPPFPHRPPNALHTTIITIAT